MRGVRVAARGALEAPVAKSVVEMNSYSTLALSYARESSTDVVCGHENIYGSASHIDARSCPLRDGAALRGHLADELAHLLALLLAATVSAEL